MKALTSLFICFVATLLSGVVYSNLYLNCDELSESHTACESGTLLYLVPEGALYANRIHNPRKIPTHWCPKKPYMITRAELKGQLLNAKEMGTDTACGALKRYTANVWAGDPYCLDPNFERRTKPDWSGSFYACTKNMRAKIGETYFLVYAIVGDAFDYLDQVINDNKVLNSDSGEMQRGFVTFKITQEEAITPVVKVSQTQEENLEMLDNAIQRVGSNALQVDCQIRPHNYENNEKFDAFVMVSKLKSGEWQEVLSLNVLENVSHGDARMALDIEHCQEVSFFGY